MTCIYKNKLTVTTYLQLALIKGFHFVRRSVAYVGGGILRTTHGEVDFHLKLNPGRQLKSNTFFGQIVIKTLCSNLIQILSFLALVQVRRLFRYEAIKASSINPSTTGWTHPFIARFQIRKRSITTFLLTSVLRGSDSKGQLSHCLPNTNVFVLGKQRDNFPLVFQPLKTDVNKNVVIERFLN